MVLLLLVVLQLLMWCHLLLRLPLGVVVIAATRIGVQVAAAAHVALLLHTLKRRLPRMVSPESAMGWRCRQETVDMWMRQRMLLLLCHRWLKLLLLLL